MAKKRVAAAVVAPELAVPAAAVEQASGVGGAIVKAATTPFITRTRRERWDPESEQWVPDTRELGVNVTPVGVLAVGALGIGVAAVAQRGLRTGTLGLERVQEVEWISDADTAFRATGRKVWVVNSAELPDPKAQWSPTGRIRVKTRPVLRTREDIADYPGQTGAAGALSGVVLRLFG